MTDPIQQGYVAPSPTYPGGGSPSGPAAAGQTVNTPMITSPTAVTIAPATDIVLGLPAGGNLKLTGATSTPGAAAGTLTNAPNAGNPQTWLQVSINGVTHFIPAWHT